MKTFAPRRPWLIWMAIAASALLCDHALAAEPPALAQTPVIKHLVEIQVVSGESAGSATNDVNLRVGALDRPVADEGVTLTTQETASALDIAKVLIARSDLFRLVEIAGSDNRKGRDEAAIALSPKFGVSKVGKRVFLRLFSKHTGTLLASSTAEAPSFETAIEKALREIEKEMLRHAWRCRVTDVQDGRIIIAQGRLDGIRPGQRFSGYTLAEDAPRKTGAPDELTLMKHGTRAGTYEAVEAGQEFTQLRPLGDSKALAVGDVIELPPVYLPSDDRKTGRGTRVWNEIYDQ